MSFQKIARVFALIRCFFVGHEWIFKSKGTRLYAECMHCLGESGGYIITKKESKS